jgi:hypothetical protein
VESNHTKQNKKKLTQKYGHLKNTHPYISLVPVRVHNTLQLGQMTLLDGLRMLLDLCDIVTFETRVGTETSLEKRVDQMKEEVHTVL